MVANDIAGKTIDHFRLSNIRHDLIICYKAARPSEGTLFVKRKIESNERWVIWRHFAAKTLVTKTCSYCDILSYYFLSYI